MSSHLQDSINDILSDNVQELLNGELFNSTSPKRFQKLRCTRVNSMNSDSICSSAVSRSFLSLQNIALNVSNNSFTLPEDVLCSTEEEKANHLMEGCNNHQRPKSNSSVIHSKDGMLGDDVEVLKKMLEEKDRQLQIAAQYGIGLVNKSEELEVQLVKERESFKEKLEEANSEKHQSKRLLESRLAEHETIVLDLKSDISTLKKALDEERKNTKATEKEYQEKIQELSACNEVLSEQILSASIHEEEARNQVCNLRLQVSECEIEQCDQVQALQSELAELRSEMERMVKLKGDECRILSSDLDVTQERLVVVEKERAAEVAKASQFQEELLKLEDKYVVLLSKIESPTASMNSITSTNPNEMSLFAELDILSDAAVTFDFLSGRHGPNGKCIIGTQLRQEILEVYRQIQRLIMEVKGQGNLWSPEVVDIADLKAGQLLLALSELQDLMSRRFGTTTLPPLNDERSRLEVQLSYLKEQSNTLREQLCANQMTLDSVKAELAQKESQLKQNLEEKEELEKIKTEQRKEIAGLYKSLDGWRDERAGISKDEALQEIQKERDEAMESKHSLQDQVVLLKLDLTSLDRQLIESVEQKLQLSNQLEAWQNDMHDLIENKMAGEIARDSLKGRKRSPTASPHIPARPSYLKKFTLRWS